MPTKAKTFRQRADRIDCRPAPQMRGYDARWAKLSRDYRASQPICQRCHNAPSELVHHIRPISAGGQRLDVNNLLAVCRRCHYEIHKAGGKRQ